LQSNVLVSRKGKFEHHEAVANFAGEGPHARNFLRAIFDVAGFEVNFPSVKRTNDGSARDDSVGQRASTMRALVFDSEEMPTKIEDGDVVASNLDGATFA